jgi:hypothetical protein
MPNNEASYRKQLAELDLTHVLLIFQEKAFNYLNFEKSVFREKAFNYLKAFKEYKSDKNLKCLTVYAF